MSLLTRENIKQYKTKIVTNSTPILLGVCVVLCLIIVFFYKKSTKVVEIDTTNTVLLQKVTKTEDINTKMWSTIKQLVIDKKNADAHADSLARALKLKPKFIKGQDMYTTKVDTIFRHLPSKTVYIDTLPYYVVEKHDPYVDIKVVASKDGGSIEYSSRDSLYRLEIVKTSLLGNTTRTVYLRNTNPYNKIMEGYAYKRRDKKAYLTIGPSVGINYNGKATIGVSIQYPLIQFKK